MGTTFTSLTIELFVGFFALIVLTKTLGKSQINQLTPFDFISALVLGELVGNAIYDREIGIHYVLYAVGVWGLLIFTIEIITQKFSATRPFLEGTPTVIIEKGKISYQSLKRNKLDLDQLQLLLREKDVFSIREVWHGILESNGSVSVVKKQGFDSPDGGLSYQDLPVSLVMDGELKKGNLEKIGMSEERFLNELVKRGIPNVQAVLFAEWLEEDGLEIQTY